MPFMNGKSRFDSLEEKKSNLKIMILSNFKPIVTGLTHFVRMHSMIWRYCVIQHV